METYKIDEIDLKILKLLQSNGRLSKAKIAQSVHLSEVPCWRRVRQLENCGFISSYVALINQAMLGYSFYAFVQLKVVLDGPEASRLFRATISQLPEILGLYSTTGEFDYVLFVVARDVNEFGQFLEEQLRHRPGICRINTSVVLETIKSDTSINLQLLARQT